jgi:hypothetical protein
MRDATVLKTGLLGHIYRALRDGGVIAVVAGLWMLGATLYPALNDGRADATVTGIEFGCAFNRDLGDVAGVTGTTGATPNCNTPALVQAGIVREVKVAKLTFESETGESHRSEIPLDDLKQPDLQSGDNVQIAYSRDYPEIARAVPGLMDYAQGLALLTCGLIMLALVWFARRAANYRSDVDAEVAELERAYKARVSTPS